MNPIDDQLNRLFRAAGQVQSKPVSEPAYGLEARVMAAWRGARTVETGFWDMALLLRGLVLASLIMAISFLPAWRSATTVDTTANPFAEYLQLTDSTVPSGDTP